MGLKYISANGGPICFESVDVQLVDGVRDIPYEGALSAVLVRTDAEHGCRFVGMIFDDQSTLIVECLHGEAAVIAFRATCAQNQIIVAERTAQIATPCPPPTNQRQIEDWRRKLFRELRPTS